MQKLLILERLDASHDILSKLQSLSIATRKHYNKQMIKDGFYIAIMGAIQQAEQVAKAHIALLEQEHNDAGGLFNIPIKNRFSIREND